MSRFKNYRVSYLSTHPANQGSVFDKSTERWLCEDLVPAASENGAVQQIITQGGVPVSVQVSPAQRMGRGVSADYRHKLLMSVLFAVQAGSSAGAALEAIIAGEKWPLRGKLDPALRLLHAGSSFSEAIGVLELYDESTMAILTAGEHTGTMPQAISAALAHLQRKGGADALMKSAVTMITLDVFMAMSAAASAVFFMLPQAEKQGLNNKDPVELERWANALHIGYVSNWVLLIIATVILLGVLVGWVNYEFGSRAARQKVEVWLRRMPLLGKALLHEALAASTSIASNLLKGGVLFIPAMEITARTAKLPAVAQYWESALALTLGGAPTGMALARAPLSDAEQRVVAAHTNAIQLAEAFAQISTYRQAEGTSTNKAFVVTGLVLSFLYSAIGIGATLYVNYVQISGMMSGSGL